MTTFREILLINKIDYKRNNHLSLDEWFNGILDIPLDELDVGDIARAIRQDLFLAEILPRAEVILRQDPLAGEDYDGQLISSIASLDSNKARSVLPALGRISYFLNQLDKFISDNKLIEDIEKIDKLFHT
ncbi:contact-dependent growth inhibition system immunity protein [Pantoea septica]|uniref:contact-dependent growth inhibition system immunity protein n=1 Tax=Pantoea septica TaxID=472695 RepID=UPI0005342863|nr:contact-dependent growth inhibition system immunity protein [Pantoea septica]